MAGDVKLGGLLFLILFESVCTGNIFCIVNYFFVVFSEFNVIVFSPEGWVRSKLQEKPIKIVIFNSVELLKIKTV